MKKLSRIVSLILASTMMLSTTAFAAEKTVVVPGQIVPKKAGMTASQMLIKSNENANLAGSYKMDGTLSTKVATTAMGETQDMDVEITQKAVYQAPDKCYLIQTANAAGQKIETQVLLDGTDMYMKTADKWEKMDISGVTELVQKISGGSSATGNQLLSNQDIKLYQNYTTFGEDKEIEGKNYYAVNVALDKDAFKKIMKSLFNELTPDMLNGFMPDAQSTALSDEDMKAVGDAVKQLLENMEIEMTYTYYIDAETLLYTNMDLTMDMNMSMDIAEVKAEAKTTATGSYKVYDYGKEVTFPNVK